MMHWLMEPEVFKEDAIPIIQALDSIKTPYTLTKFGVPYDDYIRQMYIRPIAERDVIFYGSFQFAELIKKTAPKIKIYGKDLKKYNCTSYYPAFGDNLLNADYIMLPLGDLERRILSLNHILGVNHTIFIRPDAINKAFTVLGSRKPLPLVRGYLPSERAKRVRRQVAL